MHVICPENRGAVHVVPLQAVLYQRCWRKIASLFSPRSTSFTLSGECIKESSDKKLYLRHNTPSRDDYFRPRLSLMKQGVINIDRDYKARIIRVLGIPDLPAEDNDTP